MPNIIERISTNAQKTRCMLNKIIIQKEFPKIYFDEAAKLLSKQNNDGLLNISKYGQNITAKGELELFKIFKKDIPIWLTEFDRDVVAFYQKPTQNKEKTINADLIFPPIIKGSFGGEIIGSGQRQDNIKEMYESLRRQKIKCKNYQWYIDIRRFNDYKITSGFGMGIERFIAWALAKKYKRCGALSTD